MQQFGIWKNKDYTFEYPEQVAKGMFDTASVSTP